MDRERLADVKYRTAVLLTASPPPAARRLFRLLYFAGTVASIGVGLAFGWLLSATRPTGVNWLIVGLVIASPFAGRFAVSIFTLTPFLATSMPYWSTGKSVRIVLACVAIALLFSVLVVVLTR